MKLKQTIAPYAEPLHLDEVKAHCHVTHSSEDVLIGNLIAIVHDDCEKTVRKQMVTATFELVLDDFPAADCIVLPRPPLVGVSSISYKDTAGDVQTLATSVYLVDTHSYLGTVWLKSDQVWPSVYDEANAVTITFIAGFITPFTAVAETGVITARGCTFTAGDLVRLTNSGGSDAALPGGLAILTDYYVIEVDGFTFKLSATSGGSAITLTSTGTGAHFVGTMPEICRGGMLVACGDLFENRESFAFGAAFTELPHFRRLYSLEKVPRI